MYVITSKNDNRILMMGSTLEYLENGYPLLVDENTAFNVANVNVLAAENVPDYVTAEQYTYTVADGFQENENYKEPSLLDDPAFAAGYEQALLDLMELDADILEEA